jgi:hypothetical protein
MGTNNQSSTGGNQGMSVILIEALGTVGAATLLTSYFLVSTHRLNAGDGVNHLLNLVGAALIALNAGFHHAMPPAVLNILWGLLAGRALLRQRR